MWIGSADARRPLAEATVQGRFGRDTPPLVGVSLRTLAQPTELSPSGGTRLVPLEEPLALVVVAQEEAVPRAHADARQPGGPGCATEVADRQ